MESSRSPTIAKRLLHIVQVVYYMLRKGIPKSKLMMDLHLLLKRGKIAGKALTNLLMAFHHHHHHHQAATAGRRFDSKEVEFSCSNTPSYAFNYFQTAGRRKGRRHRDGYNLDAEAMARAFEMMSTEASDTESTSSSAASSAFPTPSPLFLGLGRSPMMVRKLRITDSPFPIQENEAADAGRINQEAEEFIKNFYEQLRWQQLCSIATPESVYHRST